MEEDPKFDDFDSEVRKYISDSKPLYDYVAYVASTTNIEYWQIIKASDVLDAKRIATEIYKDIGCEKLICVKPIEIVVREGLKSVTFKASGRGRR
jgi:hypothetical protein